MARPRFGSICAAGSAHCPPNSKTTSAERTNAAACCARSPALHRRKLCSASGRLRPRNFDPVDRCTIQGLAVPDPRVMSSQNTMIEAIELGDLTYNVRRATPGCPPCVPPRSRPMQTLFRAGEALASKGDIKSACRVFRLVRQPDYAASPSPLRG